MAGGLLRQLLRRGGRPGGGGGGEAAPLLPTAEPSPSPPGAAGFRRAFVGLNRPSLTLRSRGPKADRPFRQHEVGPHFEYEVNDLLRVVDEGGDLKKVCRYNESSLLKFGFARFTNKGLFKATIFGQAFIWQQLLVLYVFMAAIAGLTYVVIDKYANDATKQSLMSSAGEFIISGPVQSLVGFILGLFVNKTVEIWWDLRHQTMQELMNIVENMSLRMAIYFPGTGLEDATARHTIMRYGIASVALLFKDAREVDAWSDEQMKDLKTNDFQDLIDDGLLTEHEVTLLAGEPSRSQICWVWISSIFTKWCLDGRLPDPVANQDTFLKYSEEARNAIGTVLAQLNMQFPLTYTHLVIMLCKVYMYAMALEAGVAVGVGIQVNDYSRIAPKIIVMTLGSAFYQGLVDIKEHISNPFRDDITDYSFKMFHARLQRECQSFFKAAMEPPYTSPEHPLPAVLPPQFLERQVNTEMYNFEY